MFAYLGEKTEYTEATVSKYTGQIFSALQWLHSRKRAHLDLKPENVLIDREIDVVKLIDFGEAVRTAPLDQVVPPVDLEFAAPESVLGRPTGSYTDMWAAGVFLYVLLRYSFFASFVYFARRRSCSAINDFSLIQRPFSLLGRFYRGDHHEYIEM